MFPGRYATLRGCPQESYYNVGRACHQLGLNYLAVHYYEKALTASVVVR
jgi:general transcription factor 3C polypeptide 3 (transcription factor C subunit 4)